MTIIVGSYSELEKQLLVGSYYALNRLDREDVSLNDVSGMFSIDLNERWAMKAIQHFADAGWSDYPLHIGDVDQQGISLTAEGLREAERLIEAGSVVLRLRSQDSLANIEVPAADRVVRLDHNEIQDAEQPISQIVDALEQDNGDPDQPGLREILLGQIKAGRELIRAGEYRAFLLYEVLVCALDELIKRYKNPAIVALANAFLGAIVSQLLQAK